MGTDLVARAEAALGYRFTATGLLAEALTHPSYAAENPGVDSYDRLEFLGDAVLGFIVADETFRRYPDEPEGHLTKRKHSVVSGAALAPVAAALGVSGLLRMGRGAEAAGERDRASVLENALEALVGAIYLDGGLDAARDFVSRFAAALPAHASSPSGDAKSLLQQRTQSGSGSLPTYRIVSSQGPPHARTFFAEVRVDDTLLGTGSGNSKQQAEKAAAAAALALLDDVDPAS